MFVIHASVFNSNMKRRWWYKWAVIQWRSIRRSRQKHSIRLLCLSKSPCERCIMRQRQHCAWPTKSMSLCLHCSFTTTFCEPKPNFISADSGITTKRIVSVYSRKNLLNEICKYTKKNPQKNILLMRKYGELVDSVFCVAMFLGDGSRLLLRFYVMTRFEWLFLNFSLPTPAIVKILQLLITITVLINFSLAVKAIRMICRMLFLSIMPEHFQCWGGGKLFVARKTKETLLRTLLSKSRVHCINVLTIFIVSSCHFYCF